MKNFIALICAVLALSACGKSLHLSVKATDSGLKVETPNAVTKPTTPLAVVVDGQLAPFSDFDQQQLGGMLPYLNKEDLANSVRTLGEPAFTEVKDSVALGYVKRSNLVFRAVLQVPPKDAITKVDRFAIQLKGLRKFSEKQDDAKTLSKQVLCILDTRSCSGEKADSTPKEKQNLNPEFWSKATLASDSFSSIKTGQVLLNNAVTGESISTPEADTSLGFTEGEETIDMRTLFGLEKLTDAELVDWIYANSTAYAEPGYRKFRFVMGNNVYFDSGDLILQVEEDDKKLPTDFSQAPGKPVNGDQDLSPVKLDPATPSVGGVPAVHTDLEVVLIFEKLKFETGVTQISKRDAERIRATGLILSKKQNLIEGLKVVGQTDPLGTPEQNLKLSLKRAQGVMNILKQVGVPSALMEAQGLGEVKASSCLPWDYCPEDRTISLQFQLSRALTKDQKAATVQGLSNALKKIWN